MGSTEQDDNEMQWEVWRNIELALSHDGVCNSQLECSSQDESCSVSLQIARAPNRLMIRTRSVQCHAIVYMDNSIWMSAEISYLWDINSSFLQGKIVFRCMSSNFSESCMKQTLHIRWSCAVRIPIPIIVKINMHIMPVEVAKVYQPGCKGYSLPPCHPYLPTSNLSPINKVKARCNGQCWEKDPFHNTGWHIWRIENLLHMTTSSSEWRQEKIESRMGLNCRRIEQVGMQKPACGEKKQEIQLVSNKEKVK